MRHNRIHWMLGNRELPSWYRHLEWNKKITQYSNNDEYYHVWLSNKTMLQIVMKKINTRQCWKDVYFHQDAGHEKKKNQTGLTCWSFIQNIRTLIHRLFVQWCAWPRHLVIVQFEKCCCWPIERGGDQTCRPILFKQMTYSMLPNVV